jgi:hypothetical protein
MHSIVSERTGGNEIMWTVWELRSIDGKQVVRVIRRSEPMDQRYQHEYQRIVYRGENLSEAKKHAS